MRLLYAVGQEWFATLFSSRDQDRIARVCDRIVPEVPAVADKEFLLRHIGQAQVVVTSWGTAALDAEVMAQAKELRLLCHAAGSVKPVVSDALWDARVRVTGAAAAIAYGVAEFALGLILTACKRAFWTANGTRQDQWQESLHCFGGAFEIYQQKVGVIGAGHVGRHLIRLLKNFDCDLMLFDPYCSDATAAELGVVKVSDLDDLFSQCLVVSLNAPSTPETQGMLRGRHFARLPQGALFVNTARNAVICEPEFVEELKRGRFVACLDVTDPAEPCPPDHPYRQLPNVVLTPHEAGVVAQNRLRIGTFVADEIDAFLQNRPLHYEVTREQLSKIG